MDWFASSSGGLRIADGQLLESNACVDLTGIPWPYLRLSRAPQHVQKRQFPSMAE